MRHARITIVMLLLGVGLLGAYFGVRGQDPRLPWPPAPVVPPASFEESEAPPERPAPRPPVPRPVTPPELPKAPIVPARYETPVGPDLPPPAPIQVELAPTAPAPAAPLSDAKKVNASPQVPVKPAPLPMLPVIKTAPDDKANEPLIVLPPGPAPLPVVVQPNPEPLLPVEPYPKPANTPPAHPNTDQKPWPNTSDPNAGSPAPPKLKAFVLVNPVRRPGNNYPAPPLEPPLPLERTVVQGQPVAQSNPVSPGPLPSGNATPQVTIDKRGPVGARAGEPLQFYIVVRNIGLTPATQVRVEDEIPVGTRIVSADPQPVLQSERAVWIIPALAPGAEKQLKIELQGQGAGELVGSTSVLVSATTATRIPITREARIGQEAALSKDSLSLIVKAPAKVTVGSQVVFEIQVTNHGRQELKNLILYAILPSALRHPSGHEIDADVGKLAAGATKTFKMPVTATESGRFTADIKITAPNGHQATGQGTVQVMPLTRAAMGTQRFPSVRALAK